MSAILIGTSGFFYDDWKGKFYPNHMAKKDFLEFYAMHFKALELNFSYYRIPGANQSRQMMSESKGRLEFRQKEWLRESLFKRLQELGAGFVCVDEPPLPSLIPPVIINTSNSGYIRFHGRNKKKWYGTDSRERYDYLYSEEELKEWAPKIKELADRTEKLFVFFNNHAKAQAVTNAKMVINLLS